MDNRTNKRRIGDQGEEYVLDYLRERGYEILDRNYLKKWGELDIVALKDSVIHFVEVKTVSREIFNLDVNHETFDEYRAEDNMHPYKLKRLARTIQTYLLDNTSSISGEVEWQFDLAVVHLGENTHTVYLEEDLIL